MRGGREPETEGKGKQNGREQEGQTP